jgi:hypothetical protein
MLKLHLNQRSPYAANFRVIAFSEEIHGERTTKMQSTT